MGDIDLFHCLPPSDFDIGRTYALATLVLAGPPLAPMAALAALVTVRRAPRRWSPRAGSMFRSGFFIQAASLCASLLLVLLAFGAFGVAAIVEPAVLALALSVAASAAALPGWRAAVLGARSAIPLSILDLQGGRRFRPGLDLR